MSRNNKQRYDGALEYIRTNISQSLVNAIKLKVKNLEAEKTLGGQISLSGKGYRNNGTKQQHWAVRALCMCQQVFLKSDEVDPFVRAGVSLDTTKEYYKGKDESLLKSAIRCYEITEGATIDDLAEIARTEMLTTDDTPYETSLRTDKGMGTSTPVCFHAVRCWLYKAGFVSLRWMATTGYSLTANNCNDVLGWGEVISAEQMSNIPVGYLFNFHSVESPTVTHWGISLGNGIAAGSNTVPQELDYRNNKAVIRTQFSQGGSAYGIFTLESAYNVCSNKYMLDKTKWQGAIVRQINPRAVDSYF